MSEPQPPLESSAPPSSAPAATARRDEPYNEWAARQQDELLARIAHNRRSQRRWTWIAVGFLAGDVVAAAVFWDVLLSPLALRGQLLEAWGWLAALLFLALVSSVVSVWHQTRIRDARYLLALLGSERGELIRNIVDAQTGKPAIEVDKGLWKVVDGELVKVEPVQEKPPTDS